MCDFYENLTCFAEIIDPQTFLAQKSTFDSNFRGLDGVCGMQSQLQKLAMLRALLHNFGILEKSLTVFEILKRGFLAPRGSPKYKLFF